MILQVVLLAIACISCALWIRNYKLSSRKLNLPPSSGQELPFIGIAHLFLGDSKNFWEVLKVTSMECVKLGGVAQSFVGPFITAYGITDPDDAMTVANACMEKDFPYKFMKPWMGDGLVTTTDIPAWKGHRRIANRGFNQQVLDGFQGVFNKQSKKLVQDFASKVGAGPFEHDPVIELRALETIFQTAMGVSDIDSDCYRKQEYLEAVQIAAHTASRRLQTVWMHHPAIYKWTKTKKIEDQAVKIIHDTSDLIIQKKKKALQNKRNGIEVINDGTEKKFKAFLDMFLELPPEEALTDLEIRQEVDTMVGAGYDTTTHTLAFVLVMLGSYLHVQEKLYKELEEVFGKSLRDVEKQDLSRLVYMDAVIKETLRLYPIVPVQPRYAVKDVQLKEFTVPAGTTCFILAYGLQRDPKVWGADADQFRPERWLDNSLLSQNPGSYAAFSLGKRSCIGRVHAMMSMKTTLSHILRSYSVVSDYTKMELKLDISLRPASGCQIAIQRRQ